MFGFHHNHHMTFPILGYRTSNIIFSEKTIKRLQLVLLFSCSFLTLLYDVTKSEALESRSVISVTRRLSSKGS